MSKPLSKLHILYVEDDIEMAKTMLVMFRRCFESVIHFENGQKAFEYYMERENDIDIVITDLTMPIMDGFKLVEAIKSVSSKNAPIIVVTAHTDDYKDRLSSLDAIVFNKPLDFDDFLEKISGLGIE